MFEVILSLAAQEEEVCVYCQDLSTGFSYDSLI